MPDKDSVLEAALAYARRSWPIFPACPDKTPHTANGVLDATTDARQIEEWWRRWPEANVALDVGGAGMMVLDLDPGYDIEELEKNVGEIPKTQLRARTPRGGEHLYFTLGHGEMVSPSSSKLASHVDVRSFHSYVLLSPSTTEDGSYAWEADGKPAHRTDEMVRVANSAREKHEDRDNWIIEPNLRANLNEGARWLKDEAKVAVEGQGGDHCAYATAAYLKSLAIGEETAFDLMLKHWNPRCDPPWGVDEHDHLAQKVANAYRYNTSPPGNLTPGYQAAKMKKLFTVRSVDLPEGDETRVGNFRFVDRLGMDHIRPPSWIIKDFIPDESYVILFGKHTSFKTFVALDLALSIAAGFPSDPTWEVSRRGAVLFAAGEGRSSLAKRVAGWEQLHFRGEKVTGFTLVDPVPTTAIAEEALEAFVKEALRRHPEGYVLTVIDTLGRAMEGADENSQKDASQLTALVHRLRTELGGSVLVLHHTGLQEEKRPRGSSVLSADPDTMARTSRRGRDHLVSLTMTKQKDAPEWDDPRRVKLAAVHLPSGGSTMVAVPPGPEDAAEKDRPQERETALIEVIDGAVGAILQANPLRAWTQRDLAEAVAMQKEISIDSKTLASTYLIRVREEKGTLAHRAYDPLRSRNAGRWRWPD